MSGPSVAPTEKSIKRGLFTPGSVQSRYWRYISSILQWAGLDLFDISWFIKRQVATGG